jgi:hypothetical protein
VAIGSSCRLRFDLSRGVAETAHQKTPDLPHGPASHEALAHQVSRLRYGLVTIEARPGRFADSPVASPPPRRESFGPLPDMKESAQPRMRISLLALSIVLVGGCTDGPNYQPHSVTVRDSSGVRIVQSTGPEAQWKLSRRPIVDFGMDDADPYIFAQIKSLAVQSTGNIVVVDRSAPHVRLFDAEGSVLATTGSEGDGPGEFRWPGSVVILSHDSVGVMSELNGRLSVFDAALKFVETRQVESGGDLPAASLTPIGDGHFLVGTGLGLRDLGDVSDGLHRPLRPLRVVDKDGRLTGAPGSVPWADVFLQDGGFGIPLFGHRTMVSGNAGQLVVGLAESFSVQWQSKAGAILQIARFTPGSDLSISDADVAVEIQQQVEAFGSLEGGTPGRMAISFEDQPRPSRKPAYSRMLVDSNGYIWLGEYRGDPRLTPPELWYVLAPNGAWVAVVELPASFTPRVVLDDRIIGVGRNRYDVETVLVFSLTRTE